MARMVVVYLFMTLFWKMRTGRVPACSEPRVGLRSASQMSPRLTVIQHPLSLNLRRNPLVPLQPARDPPRQIRHIKPLTAIHLLSAAYFERDISETPDTGRPLRV